MAASLRKDPSLAVEVVDGHYGEFTVLIDGEEAITAGAIALLGVLPSLRRVREAVERKRSPSDQLGNPEPRRGGRQQPTA